MTDAFIEGLKLCRLYSDFRPRVLRGPGLGSGPLSLLIWLTSIFWEQKPGVDLEPLSSRVAHVASLSMAEKQLICSFPSLLDITITVLCQQSTLKSIFAWSREIFVCAEINGSVSNRVCWWSEPSSGLAQPRRTARADCCLPARTGPALRLLSLTTLDISTIKWSQQEKMTEVSQLKVYLTEFWWQILALGLCTGVLSLATRRRHARHPGAWSRL